MENIFTSLSKYKPQEQITPLENFFTESLEFILNLDPHLLNKFVKKLTENCEITFKPPFVTKSQQPYSNSIIDLEIKDKRGEKIFVEIKVEARENQYFDEDSKSNIGQVEKYLRLNKGHVCLIAKNLGEISVKSRIG